MTKEINQNQTQWTNWIASVTDRCDNRCPGCYRVLQESLKSNGDMGMDSFTRILDIFQEQGGKTVDFVGGEPLMNPNFRDMLNCSLEKGQSVWVYTNLRQFSRDDTLADDVKALSDKYPAQLTIVGKLNVPDIENPEQMNLQKKLIGSTEQGAREMWGGLQILLQKDFPKGSIGIENLLRKNNISLAPAVYELGLKSGFFVDLELPSCPATATREGFFQWLQEKPTKDQVLTLVSSIAKINTRYDIPPYIPMPPHITGRNADGVGTGCISFKQGALLTEADGRIGLCTSGLPVTDENGRQLNILTDSIESIVNNPTVLRRRASTIQQNMTGPCNACDAWNNCMAGCAALRESVLGDVNASYPLCYMGMWLTDEELTQKAFENGGK